MDLLARELARSLRDHNSTAILLGDLDHFKQVNDTHGHLVGDQVLREVARRLLNSVRSYDFVGRYGGEEFLVVLNNCRSDSALPRADQIRKSICGQPIATDAGPLQISMSMGLLLSSEWGNRPADVLLSQADAALYAAKSAGRNRVSVAKPTESNLTALAPAGERSL